MPENALLLGKIDYVLPLEEIAKKLVELASQPAQKQPVESPPMDTSIQEQVNKDREKFREFSQSSQRSLLTCPDCGGVLWEINEGEQLAYVCQIGHRYSEDGMLEHQVKEVERALWAAVRALEERVSLMDRLSARSGKRGNLKYRERFNEMARTAGEEADLIRQVLENNSAFQQEEVVNKNGPANLEQPPD